MRIVLSLALLLAFTAIPAARADGVVTALSRNIVQIETDFAGTEIILFGAIERYALPPLGGATSPQSIPRSRPADIAVVVSGPAQNATVRRKGRVGAIWMNVATARFLNVPSYYLAASTRAVDDIAAPAALDEQGIGFSHLQLAAAKITPHEETALRDALIGLKVKAGLYSDMTGAALSRAANPGEGIRFSGNSLFSLKIPIPPNAPVGRYDIRIFLIQDGQIVPSTPQIQTFYLRKSGFERWAYKHAMTNPILYGLAAILLMVLAGFGASAVFRKI